MKTRTRPHFMATFSRGTLFTFAAVLPALGCGFHPATEVELDIMCLGSLSVAATDRVRSR